MANRDTVGQLYYYTYGTDGCRKYCQQAAKQRETSCTHYLRIKSWFRFDQLLLVYYSITINTPLTHHEQFWLIDL